MATIRKRNSKWQVQVRRKDCHPVTRSFNKRSDADEWARYMEVQADRAELPSAGKELLRCTFKDLLERYDREVAQNKNSYHSEKYTIKKLLQCKFAGKTLDQISETDFVQYREIRLKFIKPASFNREIAIVQHAFNLAKKEWGYPIKRNPLEDFKKPKVKNERLRRLAPEEYKTIQKTICKRSNPSLRLVIDLAIETGMRRGEILSIRKQHINFDSRTMLIPVTKTGYPRTIPLSSKAFSILCDATSEETTDIVFPMSANALRLAWERIKERGNIRDLHFHDLRHEAVSRLFEKGLSVPEVALISGHRNYKMLMRYTHIKPESIVEKLS